jgi:hypothetical protein
MLKELNQRRPPFLARIFTPRSTSRLRTVPPSTLIRLPIRSSDHPSW